MNRLRMESGASLEAARGEIKRIDRELDTLVNLILKGGAADRLNAKMVKLEARQKELEEFLATAEEPPPLLHPEMAGFYREQVAALHEALEDEHDTTRLQAGEILRSLIKEIVLTPEGGELKIELRGDLAGILAIAVRDPGAKQQNGRPGGAAELCDAVSQFEMVAGAGNNRERHSLMVAI